MALRQFLQCGVLGLRDVHHPPIVAEIHRQQGRQRIKQELDKRFAVAIDRAAMRAGKGSSNAYLEEWRRENRPCEGDVAVAVRGEVARLEAQFPDDLLEATVKNGGKLRQT